MSVATAAWSDAQLAALQQQLLQLLREHPGGLDEYTLLKLLQQGQQPGFPQIPLTEPLPLFHMHFLLFHLLYRLREHLWESQSGHLHISPLQIQLRRYQSAPAALSQPDSLRDYYLNINHLYETSEAQVKAGLDWFWQKLAAGEARQAALHTLALSEPVEYAAIKRRYRELAAQHHPDRGGDTAHFQTINQAMAVLERYYS